MMMIMMMMPIIFVPAKRATCWQRNARDRATGHRHYTMCCCAGGCAHFSLTAASSSSTPISFGCFRKSSSVAHFHFCYTLRWLLMAFQVPAQWQSESFYWICYDTRTPWFGQSQVLKLLSSHYQRDKSGLVWARGAPSKLPSLAK